ncbi:MAG: putative GNAT superfamily acetyltransferase [Bradymonadia bacterium]|jgi:predicted GNAT superfamily acetyltransferase
MSEIRDVTTNDFARILALNEIEKRQTSELAIERLLSMHAVADYHRVAVVDDQVVGFLIGFRETAPYENDNHAWFRERLKSFLYVDRIVVSAEVARRGIGSLLYRDFFDFARRGGAEQVTCEYNLQPPNPTSAAFHLKFGFSELGQRRFPGSTKRVSMQAAPANP